MKGAHGLDQMCMGYGVKETSDVIHEHCHHLVVVPGSFYIIHHSEEGILGKFARYSSKVGWGNELVLSCNICQSSRLYLF